MEQISDILAANIKRYRKRLHLTQLQLATELGYSEKSVSKWESGKGAPPTVVLPQLARFLQVTLDELMYEPVDRQLFLGIDGGGTKTEFLLAACDGKLLRRVCKGCSNPSDIGLAASEALLREGIFEVCGQYPLSDISVYAGIAGGTTSNIAEKLHDFLSRFGFARVENGSDARNAISAGLGEENGVAVIMGTGSVAFAQQDRKQFRIGGYGYLLGDAGSGYALGRDVISAALQCEDGSGAPTALYPLALEKCQGKTLLERLGDFYEGGKTLIASYAPLVFEALERQDEPAGLILRRNMEEIAKLIVGAAKRVRSDPVSVALCGGLASANRKYILPALEECLKAEPRIYRLSVCETSMAEGALYLAGMPRKKENGPC